VLVVDALDLLLDEAILGDQIPKRILGDKVILNAIGLALTRVTGSMRHRKGEGIRVTAEEHLDQRALSDTARSRDDEWSAV
jgi:hypothetical protein